MRKTCTALLLAIAVGGPVSTSRAQEKTWIGKTILVKKAGIKLTRTNEQGKQVTLGTLTGIDYRVLGDESGWLKVNDGRGNAGWFLKTDAVLLDNAVSYFSGRIQKNAQDSFAYNSRATAWQLKGEHDNAIKDFDEVLRLDPKAIAYYNRGNAWFARQNYDKAIADYNEAVFLDAKFAGAHCNRGIAWIGKKDTDKALADLSEAIRLDPKYAYAFLNRGDVWNSKKDYAKAIADYQDAVRLDAKDDAAINALAWILATCPDANFRNGKRAIELAREALELDKKSAKHMDALAAACAEKGDFAEAVHWQQRAIAIDNSDAHRSRLELYKKMMPYRQD